MGCQGKPSQLWASHWVVRSQLLPHVEAVGSDDHSAVGGERAQHLRSRTDALAFFLHCDQWRETIENTGKTHSTRDKCVWGGGNGSGTNWNTWEKCDKWGKGAKSNVSLFPSLSRLPCEPYVEKTDSRYRKDGECDKWKKIHTQMENTHTQMGENGSQ